MARNFIFSFATAVLAATAFWGARTAAATPLHEKAPLAQVRAAAAASVATTTMPASYYGMHVLHMQTVTPWPSVQFGTWRLWDAGVTWKQLQPTATTYNWTTLDTYVALAKQEHIDVILELGQTPQWASARPNETASAGAGAAAEPKSNALWTAYVTAVAKRYKGKIAYYEIWNEANSAHYWTGTPTELAQLTALAAKGIKSADPAAKIISPSLANAGTSSVAFLKSLFDAGLGNSVDVIGVHFYELGKTPESILADTQTVQALMTKYRVGTKPLFNTEFGWAAPNSFNSVDDQSGYLIRSMLVGWTGGIQRFVWYAWDNSNWVTVVMTDSDFKTPTMVAKAYTTLQDWTIGKEVSHCALLSAGTWSCDITDTSGDHSRVYWNTVGTTQITPSLSWTPAHKVDMYGNASAYTGGSLTISGHPLLIME